MKRAAVCLQQRAKDKDKDPTIRKNDCVDITSTTNLSVLLYYFYYLHYHPIRSPLLPSLFHSHQICQSLNILIFLTPPSFFFFSLSPEWTMLFPTSITTSTTNLPALPYYFYYLYYHPTHSPSLPSLFHSRRIWQSLNILIFLTPPSSVFLSLS